MGNKTGYDVSASTGRGKLLEAEKAFVQELEDMKVSREDLLSKENDNVTTHKKFLTSEETLTKSCGELLEKEEAGTVAYLCSQSPRVASIIESRSVIESLLNY